MPRARGGGGLTGGQGLRRWVGRRLAESGYGEVLSWPFSSRSDADLLGLPPQDMRRPAVVVANPLSEDEPLLRTTLLPGLFRVLARNIGRGFADTALFEIGLVFRPRPRAAASAPILPVDRGPSVSELASLEAALPDQPLRVAAVLAGARPLDGWWGPGRASSWPDAALLVAGGVAAGEGEAALVAGAPRDLLEDVRLFDVYPGSQVGQDRKSLAYTLRFRAPDRTLTAAEATAARDAAVAEAERQVGAVLRRG